MQMSQSDDRSDGPRTAVFCRDFALAEGQDICVLGTLPALGNWQPDQALRLTRLEAPQWQAEVKRQASTILPMTPDLEPCLSFPSLQAWTILPCSVELAVLGLSTCGKASVSGACPAPINSGHARFGRSHTGR